MNKIQYVIIALFGKAGSGKSYLLKNLTNNHSELHKIIQVTTRPPRQGEQEGVDYYFKENLEGFNNSEDLIESNPFKDWQYVTYKSSLKQNKINIGVFNISGISQMLLNPTLKVIPIYLKADSKIRLIRQLNREENPDCNEIIRRFLADEKDFLKIPFPYTVVINNYNELVPIETEILDIIKKNT